MATSDKPRNSKGQFTTVPKSTSAKKRSQIPTKIALASPFLQQKSTAKLRTKLENSLAGGKDKRKSKIPRSLKSVLLKTVKKHKKKADTATKIVNASRPSLGREGRLQDSMGTLV